MIDALMTVLSGPAKATTREEWRAAWAAIDKAYAETPLAQRIGRLRLPYYGGYTLRQSLGASGVLTIACAMIDDCTATAASAETDTIGGQ
jgi:hypothetical protein